MLSDLILGIGDMKSAHYFFLDLTTGDVVKDFAEEVSDNKGFNYQAMPAIDKNYMYFSTHVYRNDKGISWKDRHLKIYASQN